MLEESTCLRPLERREFGVSNQERKLTMDQSRRDELEAKVKEVLREHQRDGLNMIGSVEQLTRRLVQAIERWIEQEPFVGRKSA